jgi:hypothetical protein
MIHKQAWFAHGVYFDYSSLSILMPFRGLVDETPATQCSSSAWVLKLKGIKKHALSMIPGKLRRIQQRPINVRQPVLSLFAPAAGELLCKVR